MDKTHVRDVYDAIAGHFDATRYKPWPVVRSFLEELPSDHLLLDAGCGNGKNFPAPPAYCIGLDSSAELARIARQRNPHGDVLVADIRRLPFRDDVFDAALSIAVVHHVPRRPERVASVRELARCLRFPSRMLVFVWAREQEAIYRTRGLLSLAPQTIDTGCNDGHEEGDYLVPWTDTRTGITHMRFYHLYGKGELEAEIKDAMPEAQTTSGYDRDNWYCQIKSTTTTTSL